MPVTVAITSQKFFSEYRNGEGWSLLTTDHTHWLLGCVGERLRLELEIDVSWDTGQDGSPNDGFSKQGNDTFTRQSGSFIDDGFSIGDKITALVPNPGNPFIVDVADNRSIIQLTDTVMKLDGPIDLSPGAPYSNIIISGYSDLEGVSYKFGLIENAEAVNYVSKIDGSEQRYTANGVVTAIGAVVMDAIDQNVTKAWITGNMSVEYLGNTFQAPNQNIKSYKFIHEFIVLPYYVEGQLQNLQSVILPQLFANGNSLKYVFEGDFRKTINNPNEQKLANQSNILGSVGWFEQNFNGFPNNYSISNIDISEVSSGDSADGIIVTSKTRYTFNINLNSGSFVGTENVIVGVSFLPEQSEYQNTPNSNFEGNFMFDTKRATTGGGAFSSTIIQDLTVTHPGGGVLNVSVDFDYNAAQQLILEEGDNYFIWALIGSDDSLLPVDGRNAQDDRVNLIVDVNQYVKNPDVQGILSIRDSEQFFYRQYRPITGPGRTDFKGWISDNYTWSCEMAMNYFNGREIKAASFSVVAYNETTDELFTLQTHNFDLSSSVFVPNSQITSGPGLVQFITLDGTRGFNLENDDQFNAAKFFSRTDPTTGQPIAASNDHRYDITIGFRFNYEEWLNLPGVDTIFIDINEPNNGLNQKTSRYNLSNGYAIRTVLNVTVEHEVNGITGTTDYQFMSPEGQVFAEGEDDLEKPSWTCKFETRSADESVLFGAGSNAPIKSTEDTLLRFIFTPDNYIAGLQYIARITADDEFGSIFLARDLTSLTGVSAGFNEASPNSELKPLLGSSNVVIIDTGTGVEIKCLVDHTKIETDTCLNLFGRLWAEGVGEGDTLLKSGSTRRLLRSDAILTDAINLST